MKRRKAWKTWLIRILAGLGALLLLLAFTLPAFAETPVEDLLTQLTRLQRSDIDPDWLPDIQANEALVQRLLDSYVALTDDEKAQLTTLQKADLRAYFEALYQVQGRAAEEVDALFALPVPPPSQPPVSSRPPASSAPSASSAVDSSVPAQPPDSSLPASAPASPAPAPSQPAAPRQNTSPVGLILVVLLGGVLVVVLARFMVSLRRAARQAKREEELAAQARELFGEDYQLEDEVNFGLPQKEPKPFGSKRKKPPVPVVETPPEPWALAAGENGGTAESIAPATPEELPEPQPAQPVQAPQAQQAAVPPAEKTEDNGDKRADIPPEHPEKEAVTAPKAKKTEQKKDNAALIANPDRPNPIVTRSFGGQARTGAPPKRSFRQGAPEDLDAIDD